MANAVPVGYSGQSAIAMVRLRANEPTYPADANILSFLNAGVEQVQMMVGGVRTMQAFPVMQGQNIVTLSNDIQDIISASFSTGDPTQNATVYPLQEMDPIAFMDFAAGFPGLGAGPPTTYTWLSDFGTGPNGTLPAPITPYVGVIGGTSNVARNVFVQTTIVNPNGETLPSPMSQGIAVTTSQQAQVTQPWDIGNASGWNVYAAASATGTFYKQNGSLLPFGTAYNPLPFTVPSTLIVAGATVPTASTATFPSGGFLVMQLYPPAMLGQVNVYYRGRPILWADTSANSFTNLDTMAQEAVILWAMMRVLEHRGRADEAMDIYQPQFDNENPERPGIIQRLKEALQKRVQSRTGTVRDVTAYAHGSNRPFWY